MVDYADGKGTGNGDHGTATSSKEQACVSVVVAETGLTMRRWGVTGCCLGPLREDISGSTALDSRNDTSLCHASRCVSETRRS
jgi:hypothetical protein